MIESDSELVGSIEPRLELKLIKKVPSRTRAHYKYRVRARVRISGLRSSSSSNSSQN